MGFINVSRCANSYVLKLSVPNPPVHMSADAQYLSVYFLDPCSYAPDTDEGGLRMGASQLDLGSIQRRGQQEVSSGVISVRLYTGYMPTLIDWPVPQAMHIATDVLLDVYMLRRCASLLQAG